MLTTSARLLLASAACSLVSLASASAMAQTHLDLAYEFIDNTDINDPTANTWGPACTIDWATYRGETKGACFFTLAYREANGLTEAQIFTKWASTSPTSAAFFDLIGTGTGFLQVNTIQTVQAGDVIVIDATGTYTGHTAIVSGAPILIALNKQIAPLVANTNQWKVGVVDSVSDAGSYGSAHGCTDTRFFGVCTPISGYTDTGIGEGDMRLYTDLATGAFVGYTW
jgi:hypothetical protein